MKVVLKIKKWDDFISLSTNTKIESNLHRYRGILVMKPILIASYFRKGMTIS